MPFVFLMLLMFCLTGILVCLFLLMKLSEGWTLQGLYLTFLNDQRLRLGANHQAFKFYYNWGLKLGWLLGKPIPELTPLGITIKEEAKQASFLNGQNQGLRPVWDDEIPDAQPAENSEAVQEDLDLKNFELDPCVQLEVKTEPEFVPARQAEEAEVGAEPKRVEVVEKSGRCEDIVICLEGI